MIPYPSYDGGFHAAAAQQAAAAAAAAAMYPHPQHHHHHSMAAAAVAAAAATEAKPRSLFFKMPRGVPKQRERFEAEELFKKNVREMEVGNVFNALTSVHSLTFIRESVFKFAANL